MSRMLDALKRLEARRPEEPCTEPSEPASDGTSRLNAEGTPAPRCAAIPLPDSLEGSLRSGLDHRRRQRQYRRLLDNLLAPLESGRAGSIVLAGVERPEAQAETVARLGLLLADRGWGDVLLVDGDLAERSLTRRMGAAGRPGLAEVLRDGRAWADLVAPLASTRLSLLPAGAAPYEASAEADSVGPDWLTGWEPTHPLILVDGGDARRPFAAAWARHCDATYFLVPLGEAQPRAAAAAVAQLQSAGASLRGCIVTNAPPDA